MKNKIIDINKELILVIKDAQKLALSFCDGMNADIFGKVRIKRSEYERKIYGIINAFSHVKSHLGEINLSTLHLNSEAIREIEKLYRTSRTDEAEKLGALLSDIENTQNVCIAISEDCISKYVELLDASLSSFVSDGKETVVSVSELKEHARAFHLRSEEYSRKLKQ